MKKNILTATIFVALAFLVINPSLNIDAFFLGIQVWATAILPALFPFFFFTKMLSLLGLPEKIGGALSPITQKLYRTDGISGYIYTMSMLSGYPVGAKLTSDFYELNLIDKGQASRITSYTSTSGPLFIIGTVGVGMFYSQLAGVIILAAHFIGALLNGLLYRNLNYNKSEPQVSSVYKLQQIKILNKNILEDCMISSIKSITIIGGYIGLFFMIISLINNYNLFLPVQSLFNHVLPNLPANFVTSMLNGVIEVTRGCLDLSKTVTNIKTLIVAGTALISFGGFSVHFQAYTFLKKIGIGMGTYTLQKLTHCLISTVLAMVFCVFI